MKTQASSGNLYALALLDELRQRPTVYDQVDAASTAVEARLGLAPFRDPDFLTHFDRDSMPGRYAPQELDRKLAELADGLGLSKSQLEADTTNLLRSAMRTPL